MTPPARRHRSSPPWSTVISAMLVAVVLAGVVVVWVQDDPDTPLDQRLDVFLLLGLVVVVVAGTLEGVPLRRSRTRRRAWPGWSMLVTGLVGRRRK